MKLIDLIPITEAHGEQLSLEYFRKFSECCDYNALFDYVGVKDDVEIYTADLTNFGDLSLVVAKAHLVAKVTKKHAMFGLVYVLNGLEKLDATICCIKRTEKDGHVNLKAIMFDSEDKKTFSGDNVKFKNVIK